MPVKTSAPAPAAKTPAASSAGLDPATVKTINKLAMPLAKRFAVVKASEEALSKNTFLLFNDFREVTRENFPSKGDNDTHKEARQLAVTVLSQVLDIPTTAIRIDGRDSAVYVYPPEYENKKGKMVTHPSAGELLAEDASDEDKAIAIHPVVKGAANAYQRASRLVKIAYPSNARALKLVDEALADDGTCLCTEPWLYKIACGSETEIEPKSGQGGARPATVWTAKKLTEEVSKLVRKASDGGKLLAGFKGTLDTDEISDAVTAAVTDLIEEIAKAQKAADKAAAKAAGKAGKGDVE